ncbi:MAG: hypothetical protein HDT43_01045 [Ruminococcaceae bacterium]|nr:hypothetical protein [Oscillospiraceae bacterium]
MKMSSIRLLIVFIVLIILGIALLIGSIKDKVELGKPRGDLETMKASDFYNGRFVEGEIYELWDNYAVMEESDTVFGISYNTKVTSRYYAMPLPATYDDYEPKFVSLSIPDSATQSIADKIVDETFDYLINDKELPEWTSLKIQGKVTQLKGDGLKLFQEYISDIGGDPTNLVAYTINVGNDGSNSTAALIISIVLLVVGIGGTAFIVLRKILSGGY